MIMLNLENLTKTFHPGEVNEVTAVKDASLNVPEGRFVVLIGGNGSGKSTLLNLIAGTFLPDRGKVVSAGEDLPKAPEHDRASLLGRVFQDPMKGTAAGLTIEENFSLAASRGEFRGLGPALGKKLRDDMSEKASEIRILADATYLSLFGYCAAGMFLSQANNFILYYLIAFSVVLEKFVGREKSKNAK